MLPLVVLAGTFAPQIACTSYYGSLSPTRVFALHGGGRGRLDGTYETQAPRLARWIERGVEPVVLAGHSQGALHAIRFALDYPDLVSHAIGIAGPFDGANGLVPAVPVFLERNVNSIIGCHTDFRSGCEHLTQLQKRVERVRPDNITLIAGSRDLLVRPGSAFALIGATKILLSAGHISVIPRSRWHVQHLRLPNRRNR